MKTQFILPFVICFLTVGTVTNCKAQTQPCPELANIVKCDYGYTLPFFPGISVKAENSATPRYVSGEWYDAKIIYDSNGKDISHISEESPEDCSASLFKSFKIPNSNSFLCHIGTYVGPFPATGVLLIVDSQGRIYDELICWVEGEAMTIKQFSIDKDMNITIYSIESDQSKSVSLWDNSSFTGHREDQTYRISGNKFVLTKTVKGPRRTIKASDFKKGQLNLWDPFWKI